MLEDVLVKKPTLESREASLMRKLEGKTNFVPYQDICSLTDFLHQTLQAKSIDELTDYFLKFLDRYGLDRFVMSQMSFDGTHQQEKHHGVLVNFPEEWMKHYMENHYIEHDAIYANAMTARKPFLWSDIKSDKRTSSKGKQILEEAREFKLCDGVGLSIHRPFGEIIGMGLASSHGGVEFSPGMFSEIYAASHQFYMMYDELYERQRNNIPIKLSNKEREVLLWMVRGKTTQEIASIIAISPATVKFHRNNIYEKLGVDNCKLAVIKALREGIIKPY